VEAAAQELAAFRFLSEESGSASLISFDVSSYKEEFHDSGLL
jgi:hypothetical protein